MYFIGVCDLCEEDRKKAKAFIEKYCESHDYHYAVYEFETEETLLKTLESHKLCMDFLFLNTVLNNGSSIEAAKRILKENKFTQFIFWSDTLNDYSKVYEVPHIYHVKKENLEQYIPQIFDCAVGNYNQYYKNKIILSLKEKKFVIDQRKIMYMERRKRSTFIFQEGNKDCISTGLKLDEMARQLERQKFFRTHNSFIVNLNYVKEFYHNRFLLEDGSEIPISRKYYGELKRFFERL